MALDYSDPSNWTPARRAEHREKGVADRLCRQGKFAQAQAHCLKHELPWPPFPNTPIHPDDLVTHVKPYGPRSEELKAVSRECGKLGGRPKGSIDALTTVFSTPEQKEQLVANITENLLSGQSVIKLSPQLGPVTARDTMRLTRLVGMSMEEFNAKLQDKLGTFADLALDRMQEKLEKDQFKPNELSFALAIALDKRANLEGRNALSNANIAIQVNNYNSPKRTKEEMIRALRGEPLNVTPPPQPVDPSNGPKQT